MIKLYVWYFFNVVRIVFEQTNFIYTLIWLKNMQSLYCSVSDIELNKLKRRFKIN